MNERMLKLLMTASALSSSITLGACGGGDEPAAPAPVAEVVIVKKVIEQGRNAAVKELQVISFMPVLRVLEVRCAYLFPAPSNMGNTGAPDFVLLLDVAAADVEKTKAYGFSVFTPAEQARKNIAVCN